MFFVCRFVFLIGLCAEYVLAVVAQLGDGVLNVGKRLMRAVFDEGVLRIPAAHQLFQGGDVEVAVVEVIFQFGHETRHEAAVLTDAVAAERKISSTALAVGAAERASQFARKQFIEGKASAYELEQAEERRILAQREALAAQYDFVYKAGVLALYGR